MRPGERMASTNDSERDRSFTELLQRNHRRLYGYIFALVRNYADAQEVFQQTSLTLWEKFDEYRQGTNFCTWACAVARFKAFDLLKQRRRREAHFSDDFNVKIAEVHARLPSEEFEARSVALEDCIEKLPPLQRDLLRKCFGGDSSVAAVAEELGRTPHSVYSSLRNIREKLLDCIETTVSDRRQP